MINDYVILVGLGEIGVNIFKEFVVFGNDVELTAIDNSYNRVMLMNDYVRSKNPQSVDLCILGDPRDQNTLINAGLKRCTRLILALDEDADNFAVAQTVKRVIENFSEDEKKMLNLGVSRIYTPKNYDINSIMSDFINILEKQYL